jgi:hypothetical protein
MHLPLLRKEKHPSMKAPFIFVAGALAAIIAIIGIAITNVPRGHAMPRARSRLALNAPAAAIARAVASSAIAATDAVPLKATHCPLPIPNGQVLQQSWGILRAERANTLKIENHSGRNAIVKVRDPILGSARLALFVAKDTDATYNALPDGGYIIDYALGGDLDATCMTFAHLLHAGQIGYFKFTGPDNAGGPRYRVEDITIQATAATDADLNTIDADTFNFD